MVEGIDDLRQPALLGWLGHVVLLRIRARIRARIRVRVRDRIRVRSGIGSEWDGVKLTRS